MIAFARRKWLILCGVLAIAGGSVAAITTDGFSAFSTDPSSQAAFEEWLETSGPNVASDFADFQEMLSAEGVADVVPSWQLWRVDAHYARRCRSAFFDTPPKDKWRQILPTLRLLRDEVAPVTGPIEVVSAYRSPEINECVNGASQSRHLSFSAVDLVATEMDDRERLFTKLCALQTRIGARRSMGLGAYYDPDDLERGARGRFHIDAAGYRTWGFDYTSRSNPCTKLS